MRTCSREAASGVPLKRGGCREKGRKSNGAGEGVWAMALLTSDSPPHLTLDLAPLRTCDVGIPT